MALFLMAVNMKALVSYLNTEHHIPYKRLCEIPCDVFDLSVSEGSIYFSRYGKEKQAIDFLCSQINYARLKHWAE
jgi:hypothetical protein